jgi:hypothetical protein
LKQNEDKIVMARFRRAPHGFVQRELQKKSQSMLKYSQKKCFEGVPCDHHETCIPTQWVARLKRAMTEFWILSDQFESEPL